MRSIDAENIRIVDDPDLDASSADLPDQGHRPFLVLLLFAAALVSFLLSSFSG